MDDLLGNNKSIILLFLVIYLSTQIFSQMGSKEIGIPSITNYIQNFTSAIVLVGLIIYFSNPIIPFTKTTYAIVIVTLIFNLLYCFAKKAIDNESKKDQENNINGGKKTLNVIIISIFSIIAFIFILLYTLNLPKGSIVNILLYFALITVLFISFNVFKNNDQYVNKLNFPLYLYPLLFLTYNIGQSTPLTILYVFMFTTTVTMWGFFGVEWFVGPKKELQGTINKEMCRSYLGISDSQLLTTPDQGNQTTENTKNINYLYIAISFIFAAFLVAVIYTYVSVKRIVSN